MRGAAGVFLALGLVAALTAATAWVLSLWLGPAPADLPPRDRPLVPRALPAEGPLRIVALGTSLTARGPWPDRLADRLGACLDHPVEILRVARPGASVAWGGDAAQIAAVAEAAPDIVLVEFAINDADLRDGHPRAEADARTRALLGALSAVLPEAAIVELTMSPARGLRGVMRPGLAARYADAVVRAEARDGPLVDLYARWLRLPRDARGLDDGLHPDPELAAGVIVPALAASLAPAFGVACPEGQAAQPANFSIWRAFT
jgi:lysophospholipase L1-like esterase